MLRILYPLFKQKFNISKNKNKGCIQKIILVLDYHLKKDFFKKMGEAKRRKDLGLPPREKDFVLPEFNKEEVIEIVKVK